jgi:predicted RNase H-like nuclease (RuvC/YqgF family)
MMTRKQLTLTAALVTLALLGPASAFAQTARPAAGGAPSAQAMQQLQQLASERTALQAEVSRLKSELEAARKERDSLKAAQGAAAQAAQRSRGAEAELARTQGEKARVDGELAREKQRVEELVTRFRETVESMREVETDRAAKTLALAQREQELKVAQERNTKLHALAVEMIDKFEDQGFWSSLARREPFTKLKRVELENLADSYRGAADDQRLPESAARQ